MMTYLIILAACFGIGAVIGLTYILVRHGIPTLLFGIKVIVGGILGLFASFFNGMKEGWEDYKQNAHRQ